MNIIGTMASGWLSDRYDHCTLLATYYGFRAMSLAGLPFILEMRGTRHSELCRRPIP